MTRLRRVIGSTSFHAYPFKGIVADLRARAPYYVKDWTDAWNYRVVPATALIFFANVLPAIAFSLDLIETTQQYGVQEVLLASFMASFVFSVFGCQPLCIVGVTGPITVFNKTIFDILGTSPSAPNYLEFIGWVYLWAAVLHWITAALNWCNFLKYVTRFSCDTFGFFVSWVYLQYGVQGIIRNLRDQSSPQAGFVSIILSLVMLVTSFCFQTASRSPFFHRHVRVFFADYGMPISVVASSALAYWGRFNSANPTTLPTGVAFHATGGRDWLVRFWDVPGKWVGIAFPFGFILWVLFFFDHNVSSLVAQGSEFPLRKPPGFHYDFFLLGVTTFIAGLLGVPAPNGLIPQAPIHTNCLVVMGLEKPSDIETPESKGAEARSSGITTSNTSTNTPVEEKCKTAERAKKENEEEEHPHAIMPRRHEVPIGVVEQRVSNLAQGAISLVLLTGPFLHVLGLIPRGVLAGLFWYMGLDALASSGVTAKLLYLIKDKNLTDPNDPLRRVRKSRLLFFALIELLGFAATFAIVQTKGSIGFPIIILLLVPIRTHVIPKLPFTAEELSILDAPTASPFTMASVGGSI